MKPTLLILAAGMGSRYGGLKQIDGIGPNDEPIIEYSIFDAINSGFGKIVFVIRREFDKQFRSRFDKFINFINIEYVYQDVNIQIPNVDIVDRVKPWGTSHAVLVAKPVINEPFAVINADDFYGPESFKIIADFLVNECTLDCMSMIGYKLSNTLSDHGTVNRGVCEINDNHCLINVIERTKIATLNDEVYFNFDSDLTKEKLDKKSIVSMNFWGFHPAIFSNLERGLNNFIFENKNNPTAEYYIPNIISEMIEDNKIQVKVLSTTDNWFGVTYQEDKDNAVYSINKYIDSGIYPKNLWKK